MRKTIAVCLFATLLTLMGLSMSASAKTKLTVWTPNWGKIGDVIREFNSIQDDIEVTVQLINVGNNDPQGKLTTAVAGGVSPNLVVTWDDDLISLYTAGLIQPINGIFPQLGIEQKNVVKAAWEQTHYQGQVLGAPYSWDPNTFMFYNKRLLAESGYSEASIPKYLDELMNIQKRLVKQDAEDKYSQIGVRLFSESWGYTTLAITKSYGGQIWDLATQRPDFQNPNNLTAWNWLDEYCKRFATIEKATKTFLNQGSVFWISGGWNINAIAKAMPLEDVGFTRMPYPREGIPFFAGSGWAWVLPSGAKDIAATTELLKWFSRVDINQRLTNEAGLMPADYRGLQSKELMSSNRGVFARIALIEGDFIWQNPNPFMSKLAGLLVTQVKNPIFAGTLPPATALENAQKAGEALHADFLAKMKK